MANLTNTSGTGLGLSTVCTLIFVVLKLTDTIDWSWWWVLAPTLISVGLKLFFILLGLVLMAASNKSKK